MTDCLHFDCILQ